MEARLILSPRLRKQQSSQGRILEWIQSHRAQCIDTTITQMAKSMKLSGVGVEYTNASLPMVISNMIKADMICRYNGVKRASFDVNYYHPKIPGYIIDKAPEGVKKSILAIRAEAEKNNKRHEEETIERTPVKEEKHEEVSSDASEENTIDAPVEIKTTKDGLSISITLNLNINKQER